MANPASKAPSISSEVASARRGMADEALPWTADAGGSWHQASGSVSGEGAVSTVEPRAGKGGESCEGSGHSAHRGQGESSPPRFSSARRRHGGGGSYVDVPPFFERVDDAEDESLNQRWRQVMQIREQVLQAMPATDPEATEVYHLTQLGDKLHWRRNCFGLRNATARGMRAATPCSRCWTGEMQRRRGARTWCGAVHAIPTCPGIQGEARIYQPCRFCENGITQENHAEAMANGRWPRGMS